MTRYLSTLFTIVLSGLLSADPSFATTSSWGSKSAYTGFSATGLLAHNNPVNRIDPSGHFSLTEILSVTAIQSGLRTLANLRGAAAKKAATTKIYQVYVLLQPAFPFGHSGVYIENIITRRGALHHILKTDAGNWLRSQDGVLQKRPTSRAALRRNGGVTKRLPIKMNFIQYQFWQQSLKFLKLEDEDALEEVPSTYSLLNFDVLLGEPFSCHTFTIKAVGLAFFYSKIGK